MPEKPEDILKRIANDKTSPDFNSAQLEGKYFFAPDGRRRGAGVPGHPEPDSALEQVGGVSSAGGAGDEPAVRSSPTPHHRARYGSARHAQIDLLPHQLEPALAIAGGRGCRLLLADAVGLGKTIQAGLVCRSFAPEPESSAR